MSDDEPKLEYVDSALARFIHVLVFVLLSLGIIVTATIAILSLFGPVNGETIQGVIIFFALFGPFGAMNAIAYVVKPHFLARAAQRLFRFRRKPPNQIRP